MQVEVVTVRRMRLAALGLTRPRGGVADTVRGLLALQAQDLRQAEWAVGSRVPGSTPADVWAAFDAGEVVRSWPARGTLFAIAPDDLRLLLSLTAQRQQRTADPRHRQLGLTEDDVARATAVVRAELAGGGAMTRPELAAAWTAAGLDATGQRCPHLYGRLAHRGVLCLGPARGATAGGPQQAFVLLDEWAPGPAPVDRPAAVAELVRRYLAGHGPASERDLAWWSGLTLTEVRAGFAAVRDELTQLQCGDRVLWTLGDRRRPSPTASARSPGSTSCSWATPTARPWSRRTASTRSSPGATACSCRSWSRTARWSAPGSAAAAARRPRCSAPCRGRRGPPPRPWPSGPEEAARSGAGPHAGRGLAGGGAGGVGVLAAGQGDPHPAAGEALGLAEQPQLHPGKS